MVEQVSHAPLSATEVPVAETVRSLHLRVLVVEDDEVNQMVAQGVVEALGYESDLAADGAAAVAMAAASSYDAIVMDVQMPHMDGYTASRAHPCRRDRRRTSPDHRDDGFGAGG